MGGLVAELNGYRGAVRERLRTARRTRPQPTRPVGLCADHAPVANLPTTISMIAAAMTVALSEPPAARLGARILLLPEEI